MLYDGAPSSFTRNLEAQGVRVIHIRVPFYDRLEAHGGAGSSYLSITSGCYLRTQIPVVETEDKFVLYTDCDVIFRSDPDLSSLRPEYFAVSPEGHREDYIGNMNSGVMLINCENMRASYPAFESFIANNLHIGLDQDHYKAFYQGKWERLDNRFNWKPYWGINNDAVILHWHGPKPIWIKRYFAMEANHVADVWKHLVDGSIASYWHFLHEQRRYSSLLELAGQRSPLRLGIKVLNAHSLEAYIYSTMHKHSPLEIDFAIDGKIAGGIVCDRQILDVDVFGHDGHVYFLSLALDGYEKGASISFLDKEGHYIPVSYKGRTDGTLPIGN